MSSKLSLILGIKIYNTLMNLTFFCSKPWMSSLWIDVIYFIVFVNYYMYKWPCFLIWKLHRHYLSRFFFITVIKKFQRFQRNVLIWCKIAHWNLQQKNWINFSSWAIFHGWFSAQSIEMMMKSAGKALVRIFILGANSEIISLISAVA